MRCLPTNGHPCPARDGALDGDEVDSSHPFLGSAPFFCLPAVIVIVFCIRRRVIHSGRHPSACSGQAPSASLPSACFLRQASFGRLPSAGSGQAGQAGQASAVPCKDDLSAGRRGPSSMLRMPLHSVGTTPCGCPGRADPGFFGTAGFGRPLRAGRVNADKAEWIADDGSRVELFFHVKRGPMASEPVRDPRDFFHRGGEQPGS